MIALFISILAVILTIILYKKRVVMIPLRAAVIVLLLLVISDPGITIRLPRDTVPIILLDRSSSMAHYRTRIAQILEQVAFPHTVFAFGEGRLQAPAADTCAGPYTDITSALLQADRDRPGAILLVSDGNHNYGPSPLTVAEALTTPVYCFGVGEESPADIAVTDVTCPQYAFIGDPVEVGVTVTSRGYAAGTARVRITQDNSTTHRDFPLSMAHAKHTLSFPFTLQEPRTYTFTIEVTPEQKESTYDNNRAVFSLHVLPSKIRAVYFTDHPSFNTKFLLRALRPDAHIELHAFMRRPDGTFLDILGSHSLHIPAAENIDVLLLDNVNPATVPWDTLNDLVQNGLGIICTGEITGRDTRFEELLPIRALQPSMTGTFAVEITQPFSCLVPGDDLAPFTHINRVIGAKETAVIIAETNSTPLIAYQRYGSGIVFQIAGIDIGTWQFMQAGLASQDVLSRVIADAVRFVSSRGMNARLVLRTMTREYTIGETVDVTLESYDRDLRRSGGGDFYLTYHQHRIPFYEVETGIYRASFTADTAGTLCVQAAGTLRDEPLRSEEIPLTVSHRPIEYDEGLNRELLAALAEATGGTFKPLSDIVGFQAPAATHASMRFHPDIPATYVLIVLLLAAEWILRKRRGII